MHRQGFDLQLTQYDERGWRATFYTSGMEHSPTSATGTGWERTPWRAVQVAALVALLNAQGGTRLVTSLERLGFAVIGFMVAMIGVWISLRRRDGWH
jgi:hypothetical protein